MLVANNIVSLETLQIEVKVQQGGQFVDWKYWSMSVVPEAKLPRVTKAFRILYWQSGIIRLCGPFKTLLLPCA